MTSSTQTFSTCMLPQTFAHIKDFNRSCSPAELQQTIANEFKELGFEFRLAEHMPHIMNELDEVGCSLAYYAKARADERQGTITDEKGTVHRLITSKNQQETTLLSFLTEQGGRVISPREETGMGGLSALIRFGFCHAHLDSLDYLAINYSNYRSAAGRTNLVKKMQSLTVTTRHDLDYYKEPNSVAAADTKKLAVRNALVECHQTHDFLIIAYKERLAWQVKEESIISLLNEMGVAYPKLYLAIGQLPLETRRKMFLLGIDIDSLSKVYADGENLAAFAASIPNCPVMLVQQLFEFQKSINKNYANKHGLQYVVDHKNKMVIDWFLDDEKHQGHAVTIQDLYHAFCSVVDKSEVDLNILAMLFEKFYFLSTNSVNFRKDIEKLQSFAVKHNHDGIRLYLQCALAVRKIVDNKEVFTSTDQASFYIFLEKLKEQNKILFTRLLVFCRQQLQRCNTLQEVLRTSDITGVMLNNHGAGANNAAAEAYITKLLADEGVLLEQKLAERRANKVDVELAVISTCSLSPAPPVTLQPCLPSEQSSASSYAGIAALLKQKEAISTSAATVSTATPQYLPTVDPDIMEIHYPNSPTTAAVTSVTTSSVAMDHKHSNGKSISINTNGLNHTGDGMVDIIVPPPSSPSISGTDLYWRVRTQSDASLTSIHSNNRNGGAAPAGVVVNSNSQFDGTNSSVDSDDAFRQVSPSK